MTPTLEEFKAGLQRERTRRNKRKAAFEHQVDGMIAERVQKAIFTKKRYWKWRIKL